MPQPNLSIIKGIRKFNHFYFNYQSLFNQHVYDDSLSLTEIRMLYEINKINTCTARVLQEQLKLDKGYVSRVLKSFENKNIIYKEKCENDSRVFFLHLTSEGKDIYQSLENKANQQVMKLFEDISLRDQQKLLESMVTIENILTKQHNEDESVVTIRDHYTDDDKEIMIEKQREFFIDNYGFDEKFLEYLRSTFEAEIEKIWIAEVDWEFAGCIGLVKKDDKTAQLRWFIVDTSARGKGVGTKLIQTLINYCQKTQYEKISLETVSQLKTARRLYSKFGFELTKANEQFMWGLDLVEEHWELKLDNLPR
ncbi:bifunctional helix-turn-helix transcriptional regulator/GNAT family N-acetyltransferase [Paenibacillus durus]|uniref:MarR family transcriptional regulator n=1 Tax=Paenibacillus durus TaxID=44251 RepID=A0A089HJF6_PAEDU|nr:helix-turn-helix domain-containing GNAT family N-acetyltransferase [Paenibacillus durus]AIQ10810.1 MarR family transcriptional regulator [Paenibacillus durus]